MNNDMEALRPRVGTVKYKRNGEIVSIPLYEIGLSVFDCGEGVAVINKMGYKKSEKFRAVYNNLPESTRRTLCSAPKKGKLAERFRLWKSLLKPTLSPADYYTSIHAIYDYYMRLRHQQILS